MEGLSETSSQPKIDYYVISLKNNEPRMKNIEEQQRKLSSKIHIFDAVNGSEIDINNIKEPVIDNNFKSENTKHRKNEIGCFLSHYGVLKRIELNGDPNGYTVVFEDDFNIINAEQFELTVKDTLQKINDFDFDMLYIETISNNVGEKILDTVCKINMDKEFYGTQSYLIKNASVQKILENLSIIDMPIDWKYSKAISKNKLKAYTFCPYLTNSTQFDSTL